MLGAEKGEWSPVIYATIGFSSRAEGWGERLGSNTEQSEARKGEANKCRQLERTSTMHLAEQRYSNTEGEPLREYSTKRYMRIACANAPYHDRYKGEQQQYDSSDSYGVHSICVLEGPSPS